MGPEGRTNQASNGPLPCVATNADRRPAVVAAVNQEMSANLFSRVTRITPAYPSK